MYSAGKINSKGLAHKPEVRAQMERKHPTTEERDWPIPTRLTSA
jgi:hypothetical protein